MIKTAAAAALLVGVASGANAPTTQMQTCAVAGDPHYTPFTGKKDRYTVMGTGEFVLAAKGTFSVHGCQADENFASRNFRKTEGAITWNRDVVAEDEGAKVEVTKEGTINITEDGVALPQMTWDRTAAWRKTRIAHTGAKVIVTQGYKNGVNIKFATGKMVKVNFFSNTKDTKTGLRFGARSGLNVQVITPKEAGYTGLCNESKSKGKTFHTVAAADSKFTQGKCVGVVVDKSVSEEDIVREISALPCKALIRTAELACNNNQDCVFDVVAGCTGNAPVTAAQREEAKETALIFAPEALPTKAYTCPENSYVNTKTWPLAGFTECKCIWGFTKSADDDACVKATALKKTDVVASGNYATYDRAQCFCDPADPRHCSHDGDKTCVLPVLVGDQAKACMNPSDALDISKCVCPRSTMDCSATAYTLAQVRAPALARPGMPFGQQPIFELRSNGAAAWNDSETWAKVTIANVQPATCACAGTKPCLHNGVADNTCFEKQELFGEQKCPAGTTECLPEQANVQLFRSDANDASVEIKDKQCHNDANTQEKTTYCSGETPCKQQNKGDGTCMPMTTFKRDVVAAVEEPTKDTCIGTADWRLAEPAPARGWFFTTDATCDMTDAAKGCTEDTHSYAMDKWCDHNCRPKYPGQPSFCPPSHCECGAVEAKNVAPTEGWACPADRVNDGSCRCTAGTEHCGQIMVKAHKGVFSFEHLTIGTAGKYQLKVELVHPDQNTGSGNLNVQSFTSTFEVANSRSTKGECRAQDQWRVPDLPNNPKKGAGQAWFFEDDVARCTDLNADGTCKAVKQVFAMDTWCKANRCLPHTLGSHCTIVAPPVSLRAAAECPGNKFDGFGDCCQSGRVDQCNVCDGDGSTCTIESYFDTFVTDTATSAEVFEAAKGKSCPTHAPCAHLNVGDMSCVPKTYASSDKVNADFEYCHQDATSTVDFWKKGSWDDVNGKASIATGTYENGNTDCFCPDGTVDVTEKALVEDKAETEFVENYKKKVKEVKAQVAANAIDATLSAEMLAKEIMLKNTDGGVMLYDVSCEDAKKGLGRSVSITKAKEQALCGMRWTGVVPAGRFEGVKRCFNPYDTSCTNDSVRCVAVPALTHVKNWRHCSHSTTVKDRGVVIPQKQYPTFTNNDPTETKYFTVSEEAHDFSMLTVGGNVLTVKAQVVGTKFDAMDQACSASPASLTCGKDSECNKHMTAAGQCSKKGGNVLACFAMNAFTGSKVTAGAWKELLTCFAKQQVKKTTNLFKVFSFPKLFGNRRLASGVTAAVRVTTGGNNGLIGTPSSSLTGSAQAASNKFGTVGTTNAASTGSSGAAMTALIALVSVGAVVGAAVGLKKRNAGNSGFTAGAAGAPARLEVATRGGAKEDATDIL